MKICDKCREENYRNLKSDFQVYGECNICEKDNKCNEHPEWVLIKNEDVKPEPKKQYSIRNV